MVDFFFLPPEAGFASLYKKVLQNTRDMKCMMFILTLLV